MTDLLVSFRLLPFPNRRTCFVKKHLVCWGSLDIDSIQYYEEIYTRTNKTGHFSDTSRYDIPKGLIDTS